ncbi:hypothetical protein P618_200830 [Holospora obtusa F1]|uniref:Uncharacterized protein n=1 Tax=Holospora obtusa F1 TaxID=1399147 RepID=W6TGI7_HOLOB|nr:hypothetical protein [Holospora obtusa]ETZ06990.1 hypothetical protein P618_200830 [Holospora obtusa F1]
MIIIKHKNHYMALQFIELFVKISLCCALFEDSVADFDLSVGPRMLEFGKSVLNGMLLSHHIKGVRFLGLRCCVSGL